MDYLVDYNINKTLVSHHFQRSQEGQAGNQRDWLSPVSPPGLEDRSVPVDTAREPSQQPPEMPIGGREQASWNSWTGKWKIPSRSMMVLEGVVLSPSSQDHSLLHETGER